MFFGIRLTNLGSYELISYIVNSFVSDAVHTLTVQPYGLRLWFC